MQLFFWPSHATMATSNGTTQPPSITDSVATFVDEDNFAWISPSVYIAFDAISATDLCGLVGSLISRTTIGFDPTDISSIIPANKTVSCTFTSKIVQSGLTQYSYSEDIRRPLPTAQLLTFSDVAQNCSSIAGYSWFPAMPYPYYQFEYGGGM